MAKLKNYYQLPKLDYDYSAMEPYISTITMRTHHLRHHQAYVDAANTVLKKLEKAKKDNTVPDMKVLSRNFSFNIGGHKLHSLFWLNLRPVVKNEKPNLNDNLSAAIKANYGNISQLKREFNEAATTVEGSGWAALSYDKEAKRLMVMQVEKHNLFLYPRFKILLVLDVWEHAYYLDYKNDKAKYVEAFWNIVNWEAVGKRFSKDG